MSDRTILRALIIVTALWGTFLIYGAVTVARWLLNG